MDFSEYQALSRRTATYPRAGDDMTYPALGLCGEAGEVAEKVKKTIRDDGGVLTDERREALARELGDVKRSRLDENLQLLAARALLEA